MSQKYKYILKITTICLLVCLFAALCGCQATGPVKTIRFGYLTADQLHSPAVMVMKEKKLLEAAGFAVEWGEYLAGAQVMQDMAAGSLDFACCGAVPIMIAHSQGAGLAIIAGANQEGSSLVVSDAIKTVADLDGKKIGTPGHGSIQETLLVQLAKANDIQIIPKTVEVSDMPLFLQQEEIDGFLAWAPHPAKAVEQQFGYELLTSHDMMPNHQCCVLVTTQNMMNEDPETVKKLLDVYCDAYKWFMDNQEKSIKMLAKNTGVSEAVIRQALDTVNYAYPPYCNEPSMLVMAQGLLETGRITLNEGELGPLLKSLCHPELLEGF